MTTPDRWHEIVDGMTRCLAQAERLLGEVSGTSGPGAELFDTFSAARWDRRGRGGVLVPVRHPHLVDLDDLTGIDMARADLVRNTEQFVTGYPANSVLLWGERGTGKSSCVKGLLKPFAGKGLRIIEVERSDLATLPQLFALLRESSYRFILFCDDLSFAEGDASYQELKTLLDGGLEERPSNMLIYATSNRRHLMPEPMASTRGEEIHPEEAVSDRLSLADRFGLHLSFYPFDQATYLAIVEQYAAQALINLDRQELHLEAIRWALQRGQRSGRSARQFVDDLSGRMRLGKVRTSA